MTAYIYFLIRQGPRGCFSTAIANFSENPTAKAFDDPQEIAYAMIMPFAFSSICALISGLKGDDENQAKKITKMKATSASFMIMGFVYVVFFIGYKSITF